MGRVLAIDAVVPEDIPPLDQSVVDGYAVIAKGTFSASPSNPMLLSLRTPAPDAEPILKSGEIMHVHTGGLIPKGSGVVVSARALKAVSPGEDISQKGEDLKSGEVILKEGTRLKPQDLGMLAAIGLSTILVYKKPVVGILSTGSELVPLARATRRSGDRLPRLTA